MPKLWVDKKLYSVEAEVRDYAEELEIENERLRKMLEKHKARIAKNIDGALVEGKKGIVILLDDFAEWHGEIEQALKGK